MTASAHITGKVWLVGAGPGDAGLLTVKGKAVLDAAQVVVYDALVSPELLSQLPSGAEKINVGKRAGRHTMPQEEISRLLLNKAQEGKRVVRLKGGDPFLFGRGGEELALLTQHGVPYEVVPGVTSALAVPAYCGIPVTHRDYSSSVHIITGHKKEGQPLALPYQALAQTGGTLVFLMGMTALPEICTGLIKAGMDPATPAAVLEKGTTADQQALVCDLANLPPLAAERQMGAPAVIVVGQVCALGQTLAWREKLPLFGCRAVITRPEDSAGTLCERLRQLGAEVLQAPAICTQALAESPAQKAAIDQLECFHWLVFTSPKGVDLFFGALLEHKKDSRALAHARIAAVGRATEARLREKGLLADLVPQTHDGEHLAQELSAQLRPGDWVLLPRARAGSPQLPRLLRERLQALSPLADVSCQVQELPLYDTVNAPPGAVDWAKLFEDHPGTLAVFASASAVRGFAQAAQGLAFDQVIALCIGQQTARQATALGMRAHVAQEATIDALVDLVCKVYKGEVQ